MSILRLHEAHAPITRIAAQKAQNKTEDLARPAPEEAQKEPAPGDQEADDLNVPEVVRLPEYRE